jgi:hypothetical protein
MRSATAIAEITSANPCRRQDGIGFFLIASVRPQYLARAERALICGADSRVQYLEPAPFRFSAEFSFCL